MSVCCIVSVFCELLFGLINLFSKVLEASALPNLAQLNTKGSSSNHVLDSALNLL